MSEDLFDSIVMAEEIFHGEGYKEGYERGAHRGLEEGRRHGAMHGARLGAEVSFYHGFAVMWKCLLQDNTDPRSRKRVKTLEEHLCLLENSILDNPHSEKMKEDMDKLRAKFRQHYYAVRFFIQAGGTPSLRRGGVAVRSASLVICNHFLGGTIFQTLDQYPSIFFRLSGTVTGTAS